MVWGWLRQRGQEEDDSSDVGEGGWGEGEQLMGGRGGGGEGAVSEG